MKPNKFLQNRSGIYGIRNLSNDKIYVGRTKCFYKRCHQYIYDFKNRSIGHINDYLYNAMSKIGIDSFEFFILEFATNGLEDLELQWMESLNSCNKNYGYNLRKDVGSVYKVHPDTSEKISKNLKKQWADGIRSQHSDKMKEVWKDEGKRARQSIIMSQTKTKYEYKIKHIKNNTSEICKYNRLKELGLKNVIAEFSRNKTNKAKYKGYLVERFPVNEVCNENKT